MKKVIYPLAVAFTLVVTLFAMYVPVNKAAAGFLPLLEPAAVAIGSVFVGYQSAVHDAANLPCFKEPVRTAHWKGAPGYTFSVAGCDYEANKDKLVIVK